MSTTTERQARERKRERENGRQANARAHLPNSNTINWSNLKSFLLFLPSLSPLPQPVPQSIFAITSSASTFVFISEAFFFFVFALSFYVQTKIAGMHIRQTSTCVCERRAQPCAKRDLCPSGNQNEINQFLRKTCWLLSSSNQIYYMIIWFAMFIEWSIRFSLLFAFVIRTRLRCVFVHTFPKNLCSVPAGFWIIGWCCLRPWSITEQGRIPKVTFILFCECGKHTICLPRRLCCFSALFR